MASHHLPRRRQQQQRRLPLTVFFLLMICCLMLRASVLLVLNQEQVGWLLPLLPRSVAMSVQERGDDKDTINREHKKSTGDADTDPQPSTSAPAAAAVAVRVISPAELANHNGTEEPELWLSILGEVFDVSQGSEHYGENGSYRVFVGRDGTAAFVTGNFTPAAAEADLAQALQQLLVTGKKSADHSKDSNNYNNNDEEVNKKLLNYYHQLNNVWKDFYVQEDKYPFVGVLQGRYFDEHGQPTPELERIRTAAAAGKILADEKQRTINEQRQRRAAQSKTKAQEEL